MIWWTLLVGLGCTLVWPFSFARLTRVGIKAAIALALVAGLTLLFAAVTIFQLEPWQQTGNLDLGDVARVSGGPSSKIVGFLIWAIYSVGPQITAGIVALIGVFNLKMGVYDNFLTLKNSKLNAALRHMNLRKEAEESFDQMLDAQGRTGHERLTKEERAFITGKAIGWAAFWSLPVAAIILAYELWQRLAHGAWGEDVANHLASPLGIAIIVYFVQKRRLLNRAASIWGHVREREVERLSRERAKPKPE